VDAPVGDELLQRDLRDLAADRVERREGDGFWRVVDDQINAGEALEGPDVPALAADDPPLHVVVGEGNDGDGDVGGVVRGAPLDGQRDDLARSPLGFLAGFRLDLLDDLERVAARRLLDLLEDLLAGLLRGQAADPFELSLMLGLHSRNVIAGPG
jgi:hypothetical protein